MCLSGAKGGRLVGSFNSSQTHYFDSYLSSLTPLAPLRYITSTPSQLVLLL
jgi:hypothetical protein